MYCNAVFDWFILLLFFSLQWCELYCVYYILIVASCTCRTVLILHGYPCILPVLCFLFVVKNSCKSELTCSLSYLWQTGMYQTACLSVPSSPPFNVAQGKNLVPLNGILYCMLFIAIHLVSVNRQEVLPLMRYYHWWEWSDPFRSPPPLSGILCKLFPLW